MGRALLRVGVTAALVAAQAFADESAPENATKPYEPPEVSGVHWAETFDGDVWSRWRPAPGEKYNGKFSVGGRAKETLLGDVGLLVPEEARHYGASVTFAPLQGAKEASFVVQYEVRFQEGLSCGGAYLKLFDSEGIDEFKDDTPYVIMFGPDRCGATDKVHFILRHRNPKTGVVEEKHFKEPPATPGDQLSHLYGLVIEPDNSFAILIDGEKKASGNLLTSMSPAINPPKDIDDPEDKKPGDWVDEAKMDDPEASKPDDWDEDAPMMIPDASVSKPAGWVDDAEPRIDDPKAVKPHDWDDEEDGEWEAPVIDNPVCSVGCGKWEPPKISNPAYKGKWHAPKIDNPEYRGVWKPRQIPNPDYFLDETPGVLPKIDSVGIDIWTMSKGMVFDNIVISSNVAKARAFADATFKVRRELELLQQPKPTTPGILDDPMGFAKENLVAVGVTAAALVLGSIWCCCCLYSGQPAKKKALTPEQKKELRMKRAAEAERKAAAEAASSDAASSGEAKAEAEGEAKDEAKGEAESEAKAEAAEAKAEGEAEGEGDDDGEKES